MMNLVLLLLLQAETIHAEDIRKHQEVLAADEMEGREIGSEGGHKAALYIAEHVKKLGFKPGGAEETWFAPFGKLEGRKPGERGAKNIVAVWPGKDAEYVVLGAHYDHVGKGLRNSNRAAGSKPGEIHNGADDNASGTSTLLDVAEAVSKSSFRRTVVLMWFDGEEVGLAGSKAWASAPTLDLSKCRAMVNCDMIGRNGEKEVYCGLEKGETGAAKYPKFEAAVKEVEKASGLAFDWTKFDPFIKRSDHWSFMEKGIPAIFFTGGLHADYHTERDDVEKINFPKEERIGRFVYALAERLANGDDALK
jgi:Zn-dependent M28 family amino/carboxypeptidase